jgi:broad specificity phosphatase PhoE
VRKNTEIYRDRKIILFPSKRGEFDYNDAMEANILLIRHAQAYGNVSGKIGYDGKDDTLTELGIRQAISLRSQLSRVLENREYSISLSEANRTLQTASYGGIIGSNTSFVITPALNEIDMGSLC